MVEKGFPVVEKAIAVVEKGFPVVKKGFPVVKKDFSVVKKVNGVAFHHCSGDLIVFFSRVASRKLT